MRIEESLESEVGNRINFSNAILKNEKKHQHKPRFYYSLRKYKKKGSYDILTDISENATLVQLMDSLGYINHTISVVGYCIFDSHYERSLVFNREVLVMICAPSVG